MPALRNCHGVNPLGSLGQFLDMREGNDSSEHGPYPPKCFSFRSFYTINR
jgi:hypothetical protein